MLRNLLCLTLVSIVLFASACGDSPSGPDDPGVPSSSLTCVAPALATSAARPFDRVEVTGISGIGDQAWVVYETDSGATGITAVLVGDDGKAEIIVPPNPDDLVNGGTVQLTVTDGIGSCAALELEVLAYEPAEGNPLADAVTAIDELTTALAAQFGLDPATVAATSLADLPPQAIPVALLLEARAAFDPATALADLGTDDAAFLQSMIADFDLATVFTDITASVNGLSARASAARFAPSVSLNAAGSDGCGDLGTVPGDLFGLDDPETLSEYIKAARGANDSLGPLGQSISDTGAAFAVMGLAVPPVGVVAGWLAFSAMLVQRMRANLYPSAITRLEFQLDEDRIEEDWDTASGDPPVKWAFAKVWATNNGMGLARVGFDFIMTGAALPGGFGGAVADAATAGLNFAGKNALNRRLDELERDPDSGAECWGVGVTEFGPVVIDDDTGSDWVNAEIVGGDAIAVDPSDIRRIDPVNIGTATLRVRTQPDPFPGPFGFEDKTVEVLRKEVVWIPSTLLVENPGETVTIKFRVDNSKHNGAEDVLMTPGPGLPPLSPSFSGGVHSITFKTPTDPESYSTFIDVCSSSKELPPAAPERCARIDIFANERVEIDKREVCVGPGQTETFTATAAGPGDPVVRWEIESGAGSLSPDTGLAVEYTAPSSGSGTVTLRAYLESKPAVEDRISFRYGACSGLAVYYGHNVGISFPFAVGGDCSNRDLNDEFEEITFPDEGFLPLVPPAGADIWVDRTEVFSRRLSDSGVFGKKPVGSEICVTAGFAADAGYQGSLTGSVDGTRLDIDFATDASSNCDDMGQELSKACSTAAAGMGVAARFDFEITKAASYRLRLSLTCDFSNPSEFFPASTTINVIILQVEPDGTPLPPNGSTAPIQIQCDPTNPTVNIDQLMQFPAPSVPGQTNHVMVMFQAGSLSFGAFPTDTGEEKRTGSLRGFVSVVKE